MSVEKDKSSKKKKNLKVVLINLHGDTNMTASYLHSLIDKAGFDITTINFRRLVLYLHEPSKIELQTLERVVDNINPKVVCMSVNSMSFWDAVLITKMLQKRYIVVWGGVQPLIDPERCMKYVNIICRGEGDKAFLEFLDRLEKRRSINKVKNFWIKKGTKIIKNDFRPLIKNLDKLPYPDFSDNKKLHIFGNKVFRKNPLPHIKYEYNITFSRGCPYNCSYCINHFYNKIFKHKYLRRRSIKSVIDELKLAKKKAPKIKFIRFWDDVFITDTKWLKEFAKQYKEHINLPFFAYGNANAITYENMKFLKHAGLRYFDVGIQTGCRHIRNKIFKRTDTDEMILKTGKIMKKLNIDISYDLIFSEFEDEESVREGLKLWMKLPKPFSVHPNKLAYYPNFEITNLALKEGKIKLNDVASMNPKIRTQVISNETIERDAMMSYFLLLGKRLIPNFFVRYMFENKFHKKHPKIINTLGKIVFKMGEMRSVMRNMIKMVFWGEWQYLKYRILHKKDLF